MLHPATLSSVDFHRRRAVLVEDDDGVRRSLQLLLDARGYDVRSYPLSAAFLNDPRLDEIDLLVADYLLPDGDGLAVLSAMRQAGWQGKAVLITAFPSETLVEAARDCGFDRVLDKPLRPNDLNDALAF